jgi:hypothetical protein
MRDPCGMEDGWTIGADIGVMLTGAAVAVSAAVWLWQQGRTWRDVRTRRSRLCPGDSLQVGATLQSPDGRTSLTLHGNGNMVVEVEGYGVFDDTGAVGDAQCLKVEPDGWLVLCGKDDSVLWKQGPDAERFEVQNDAHVVLYSTLDKPIWATNWYLLRGKPKGPPEAVIVLPAIGDRVEDPSASSADASE